MYTGNFRRYSAPVLLSSSLQPKSTDHGNGATSGKSQRNGDLYAQASSCEVIKLEKALHEMHFNDREENCDPIQPETSSKYSLCKYVFIGICNIMLPFLLTCFYTLIPVHNVFHDQQFWYELPLQGLFSLLPSLAATIIVRCSCFLNINYIKKPCSFLRMWLAAAVAMFVEQFIGYVIWTKVLGFQYPIPLNGYIAGFVILVTLFVTLWYQFPSEWRKNVSFRKRLRYVIVAVSCNQALVFEYGILTKLLLSMPTDYQWIIALFLPLIRELNILCIFNLASKAAFGDIARVKRTVHYGISISHSLFLDYTVGSVATISTSIVIIGTDFLTNIMIGLRIVYIKHKSPQNKSKLEELVQTLVINEMVECTVPLAYLLCFTSAFYGPNHDLIGNVGNNYWQYRVVDDFGHTLMFVSMLFFIDLLSLVACVYLLRNYCNMHLFRSYIAVQRDAGVGFIIVMSSTLNAVSMTMRNAQKC